MTGFTLTLLCVIAEIMSGLGARWGFWNFRTGLGMLRWAAYGDAVAVLMTIVSCIIAGYTRKWGIFVFSIIIVGAYLISDAALVDVLRRRQEEERS